MNVKKIERSGWGIECLSPLELRHRDTGSFATGIAASIVIDFLNIPIVGERVRIVNTFKQFDDEFVEDELHYITHVSDEWVGTVDDQGNECEINIRNFTEYFVYE